MPLYVMLGVMRQNAIARCAEDENAYHLAMRGPYQHGEVLDFYAVIGKYDYVVMAHAREIRAAALLSGEIALKMDMSIQTLPALRPNITDEPAEPPMEHAGVREPNPERPPQLNTGASTERRTPDRATLMEPIQRMRGQGDLTTPQSDVASP